MTKIIRTKTRAEGGITPEEKIKLDEHAKKWIDIIMRTEPINPEKIIPAIKKLYEVSGLKEPRVIIVPSPFIGRLASGLAASILYLRKNGIPATFGATDAATFGATYEATSAAVRDATSDATSAAVREATDDATDAATRAVAFDATSAATDAAVRAAVREATRSAAVREATDDAAFAATSAATEAATRDATRTATDTSTRNATDDAKDGVARDATEATDAATYAAMYAATEAATSAAMYAATSTATDTATEAATRAITDAATREENHWLFNLVKRFTPDQVKFSLNCINQSWKFYQGGNMWGSWDSFLTAGRDVLGLDLPIYKKYAAWETCAKEGGFRFMHEDFCMVSDFPEILLKDAQNRPHCSSGPSHRWRDGFEIHHLHGVRFENKEDFDRHKSLSIKDILKLDNTDMRAVLMMEKKPDAIFEEMDCRKIDECSVSRADGSLLSYELYEVKGLTEQTEKMLRYRCASFDRTGKTYTKFCPPEITSALQAIASAHHLSSEEYGLMIPQG